MQIVKTITCLLLLCVLVIAGCTKNKKEEAPQPAQSIAELQQQLEKILKDTHTPGMSVAIVHRDGPEWIAGLGKADLGLAQWVVLCRRIPSRCSMLGRCPSWLHEESLGGQSYAC